MYSSATKRNKVNSKVVRPQLSNRASNNASSGTTSTGGYKILCAVVGLAVITFVTTSWTLNFYTANSSMQYSSLSSSKPSGIAEYVAMTFESIPSFIRKARLFSQLNTYFPDVQNQTSLFPSLTPQSSIVSSKYSLNPPLPTKNRYLASNKPTLDPSSNTPTLGPTSIMPTLDSSTTSPTLDPSTIAPSVDSTTIAPTLDPTSIAPTLDPTSIAPTLDSSTITPTLDPSSNAPTLDPTSIMPTLDSSTFLPTLDPSTSAPSVDPTLIAPTLGPSTISPTVYPFTIAPSTFKIRNVELSLIAQSLNLSHNVSTLHTFSTAPTRDPSSHASTVNSSSSNPSSIPIRTLAPTQKPSSTGMDSLTSNSVLTNPPTNMEWVLSTEKKLFNPNISAVHPGHASSTVVNASMHVSSTKDNNNKTSYGEFPMYSRILDGSKSFVENIELLTSIDAYFLSSMSTANASHPTGKLPPLHIGPKPTSAGKDTVGVTSNSSSESNTASNSMRRCNESFPPRCPNNEEMYSYVRFWNKRFSKNDCYESPLRFKEGLHRPEEEKYLLFEPDRGGWNNIRMAAETAMVLAHATGRTLVLPPREKWYLLDRNPKSADNIATFRMFFDLNKVSEAMRIISMEEFIEKVAMKGLLKIPVPQRISSVKAFIGRPEYWENSNSIYKYLERACFTQKWDPFKTFLGFNLTSNGVFEPIEPGSDPRFAEMVKAGGRKMFPYDQTIHNERCLFFPGDYRDEYRLLIHYYAYIYWTDKHMSRIYRRIVRDRLHYHDNIFCAAGRIVRALHEDAANLSISAASNSSKVEVKRVQPASLYNRKTLGGNTKMNATYFAFHIRRGDFQYKQARLSAEKIWENARPLLDPAVSNLIYIATDESDKSFFAPFLASGEFTVRFLRDYTRDKSRYVDNLNHVGMVEQIICANAHTFIGTPFSTFTGYITRMRGYYRDGRYDRTYYTMQHYMYQLQKQHALQEPFWAREFEIAHKDIDDYY